MITYEQPRLWQRAWFLASVLVMVLLAGVAAWWWQSRSVAGVAVSAATSAASAVLPMPSVRIDTALLVPPTIAQDGRPSDFKEGRMGSVARGHVQDGQAAG